ncbi:MAG: beta-propeller fold lactonase family protein [Bacteroidales bacterium]|nr:beta-propeller fold lactonase family protein [Bacteroidales bacterium]
MKCISLVLLAAVFTVSSLKAQVLHETVSEGIRERIQHSYNRFIQPAGLQVVFGNEALENHAMDVALSPDARYVAVMERYSIVFISTADNKVRYSLVNNEHPLLRGGMNTYSGLKWDEDASGMHVYWSVVGADNRSFVASATWNGEKAEFSRLIEYKTMPPAAIALPNEILITREAGNKYLYVVLNGNNTLVKQDFITGDTVWYTFPGVAPYGIAAAAGKVYVTNWAGRFPTDRDKAVAGVPWGLARVDNKAGGSTREGSVAVFDAETGTFLKDIIVGLHPNGIISGRKGRYIYVTNSNSDNVSVINTSRDVVTETISVRLQPDINPYFGDSPNGICLSPDEQTLYVANGMDNALAVISLGKKAGNRQGGRESTVTGFIPTGAYPSGICITPSGSVYVANLESDGVHVGIKNPAGENLIYNSHHLLASISVFPAPGSRDLAAYTDTVIAVNNLARATTAREEPRSGVAPKPVPERIGEPSLFRHVLYIIKENRTYDQILGDMKEGRGDPSLCTYGELITPNTHKLAREFLLLDNFNVSGKCSAEGHQWTDAAIVTDYIEKNMRAWFRSYPHVQDDALVYSPSGFLWDNGVNRGKKVRIYGEASYPVFENNTSPGWTEIYNKFLRGEKVEFTNYTTIEPVKSLLSPTYPSYGNHEFPDVMRAADFIRELKEYEAMEGDQLPELMIMALPNDHTAGLRPGHPTPRAMITDNDLALGQIVEAVTKSRFWESTVIFVTEDDSQGGWDHISAYRTVGLVISPYSRLRTTIHTYYSQPSMIRTIEQILGLPPMNIQDAIAYPMTDCFGSEPDLTPYTALPNNIPLDEMNKPLSSLSGRALHFARKSMLPEFAGVDSGNDDLLNRILWFAARGNAPYPRKYAGATGYDDGDDDPDGDGY